MRKAQETLEPGKCPRCKYAAGRAKIRYYLPTNWWSLRYVVHLHMVKGQLIMSGQAV